MHHDQPHLTPIGIHIPEFAKLYDADKTLAKMEYARELAYIYHMHEYDSPYYDRKNKEEEIIRDFVGKKRWKPTKRVIAALAKYKSLDRCAEKRALDAAVTSCDSLADDLLRIRQDTQQIDDVIKEIDLEIKRADNIDRKVDMLTMKLEMQDKQLKNSLSLAKIMPQLEKNIDTVMSLRKKVTTSVYKGESSDSTIGEFMYDKLMDELAYEQKQQEDNEVEE